MGQYTLVFIVIRPQHNTTLQQCSNKPKRQASNNGYHYTTGLSQRGH